MPIPSRMPSRLPSTQPTQSITRGASQIPLPESIVTASADTPSPTVLGNSAMADSVIFGTVAPENTALSAVPAPQTTSVVSRDRSIVGSHKLSQSRNRSHIALTKGGSTMTDGSAVPRTSKSFHQHTPSQDSSSVSKFRSAPTKRGKVVAMEKTPSEGEEEGEEKELEPSETRASRHGGANDRTAKASKTGSSVIHLPGGCTMMSTYTKAEDIMRATKQMAYEDLEVEEQRLQDQWANEKGKDLAPCPNNLSWERYPGHRGYFCSGLMHYIPDILIAEGVPGLYTTARPPPHLQPEMMPHPKEQIPEQYWGIVRPESQCPETKQWKYPAWSAGW